MTKQSTSSRESFSERLKSACAGLNFVSETDSRVVPVFGNTTPSTSSRDVLKAIGVSASRSVEEVELDKFFARLADQKEWFSPAERENAKGFDALKRLLETELANLKVIRVGKIRITIYVLGIGKDGKVKGVKMESVET